MVQRGHQQNALIFFYTRIPDKILNIPKPVGHLHVKLNGLLKNPAFQIWLLNTIHAIESNQRWSFTIAILTLE